MKTKKAKFETETARKEYYSALADELHFLIKKKFKTIDNFCKEKNIQRTYLTTVLTTIKSPYYLRLVAYLINNDKVTANDISTAIPKELIMDIEMAIFNHADSISAKGNVRMGSFFSTNSQWDSGWWGTIVKGIRTSPSRRLLELADYVLEKEIFEYLLIKK